MRDAMSSPACDRPTDSDSEHAPNMQTDRSADEVAQLRARLEALEARPS